MCTPGIEPASPALEGGFFTTGPPGKSPSDCNYTNLAVVEIPGGAIPRAEVRKVS